MAEQTTLGSAMKNGAGFNLKDTGDIYQTRDGSITTDVQLPKGEEASEPAVVATVEQVIHRTAALRAQWQKRVAEEGKVYWGCPFERGANRPVWPDDDGKGRERCQRYIDKNFANSVALAKAEGKPAHAYEPQRIVVAPKKSLEDFYDPHTRQQLLSAHRAQQEVKPLVDRLAAEQRGTSPQVRALNQPIHTLIANMAKMTGDEVQSLGRQAHLAGKVPLARAARRELLRRGEKPSWM